MTYIARIDEDACAAYGGCADVAPEVFRLDDVATVIGTGPDELLLEAAEACPWAAITVIDEGTGAAVYP
jgi:ferredoxin